MVSDKTVVEALDVKIRDAEKELKKVKRLAESIPKLEADLQSLKRTRAMFTGKEASTKEVSKEEVATHASQKKGEGQSIGNIALEIIKEAGRPVHVDDLLPKLKAKREKTSRGSLVSTLIRYMQEGRLEKTAPNTFTLRN
jgi:hypothetical protein